jgi:hypothetical protein
VKTTPCCWSVLRLSAQFLHTRCQPPDLLPWETGSSALKWKRTTALGEGLDISRQACCRGPSTPKPPPAVFVLPAMYTVSVEIITPKSKGQAPSRFDALPREPLLLERRAKAHLASKQPAGVAGLEPTTRWLQAIMARMLGSPGIMQVKDKRDLQTICCLSQPNRARLRPFQTPCNTFERHIGQGCPNNAIAPAKASPTGTCGRADNRLGQAVGITGLDGADAGPGTLFSLNAVAVNV